VSCGNLCCPSNYSYCCPDSISCATDSGSCP
jgi:hypothetical protein